MITDLWDDSVKGRRVRLDACTDQHTTLPPGLEGTANHIDALGTLHVTWDNGSTLGLVADAGYRWTWL